MTSEITHCPHCGTRTGLDCGDAEPDHRVGGELYCSVGCHVERQVEMLTRALVLAVSAPTDSKGAEATGIAAVIASRMDPEHVETAKRRAKQWVDAAIARIEDEEAQR